MKQKWENKQSEDLFKAILCLDSLGEAKAFFRDLLTEKEIIEFSNRWQVAQMLYCKKPYVEIVKKTKLSSRTIARIAKWLNSGMGGYKNILDKVHRHNYSPVGKRLC